ncbi:MAG: DUF2723 domain-containing protein [Candidatus Aminicenantes bacterium]|nr:DUF2723 domain-containing protein [Candidatus Aminicenantes bacterium]
MNKYSFKSTDKWLPSLMLLLIGLIYFSFLPVNYDFDGTVFSQYLRYALVKNDLSVTHQPQHPLYIPVNYLLYNGLKKAIGYNVLEYFHLQLFSLCFGLLTLWVAYKIIKQVAGPDRRFLQIVGMALAAFAYGPWYYSVEAEVHMAGLFFVAAGMYLLFFKPDPDKLTRTVGASLCFALAAGFHLTNGLIAVAVLLVFILEKKSIGKIVRFFVFYGVFLLLELSIFAIASKINLLDFYKNQLQGNDILAGHKISYWTGLSIGGLWGSLKSVANGFLVPASPTLTVFSLLLLGTGAAFIINACVKSKNKAYYKLGAWILPYFGFFTFWDHRNFEFKLNVVLPFIILFTASAAFFIRRMQNKTRVSLANTGILILILSIFLSNFYYYIKPAGNLENNRNYRAAAAIEKVTPPQAAIVIAGCGSDLSIHNKIYISYFAGRKVFILDWMLSKGLTLDDIRARLEQEQTMGTPVYFFSDALLEGEGPVLQQLLKNHHLEAADYYRFLEKINFKEKIPVIDDYYLNRM